MGLKGIVIGLVGALSLAGEVMAQEYRYAIFELEHLVKGVPDSATSVINESGDVVGYSSPGGLQLQAVIWSSTNRLVQLGTLGGDDSDAWSVNELGETVGWSSFEPGGSPLRRHAFLWRDGNMLDLGTLGGVASRAFDINNFSQVVGNAAYEMSSGRLRAFLWQNGEMIGLRPLAGCSGCLVSSAYAINDSGLIVGSAPSEPEFGITHAVVWNGGEAEPVDLGTLIGPEGWSSARAINELGQIVGQSTHRLSVDSHAVLWEDGRIIDLHTTGLGPISEAMGLNNVGQVVGWVGDDFFHAKAFIREAGAPMRPINDLLPPRLAKEWRLTVARDINDAGQIAATGYRRGAPLTEYALLVTPVYPTMEMAAPLPGSAGTDNTLTITNATPGARVTFLYARGGGGTRIPGCDLQQNALQLDTPKIIGTAVADQNGTASITRTVPLVARGQTVLFQAVVQGECAISQLVVHEFE